MRRRDLIELFVLAALWGGSFLFMRIAGPAFGPAPLAEVRVAGAALLLLPLLAARGHVGAMLRHWKPIAAVGLFNSAIPFFLFAWATLSIEAGIAAIVNSATPLSAAVVARLWLGERLTPLRIAGLAIGFAGVVFIAAIKSGIATSQAMPGASHATLVAIAACGLGTLSYAIAPSLAKKHLQGVPPLAVATGSQVAAAIALAVPAALAWPAVPPSAHAWTMLAALAFACTGLAYILYFRLIASAGPQNAVSVTYLVPIFAVAWGWAFLGERIGWGVASGCAVVFGGTALATGVWPRAKRRGVEKKQSAD